MNLAAAALYVSGCTEHGRTPVPLSACLPPHHADILPCSLLLSPPPPRRPLLINRA